MTETTINALVEGGKASAGPPLGPALGPMGINIGDVVNKINEKTKDFEGVKLPVKVIIDKEAKTFKIEVGSPPTSELIKKEMGIEKGRSEKDEVPGDIPLEKVIKVAKMKKDKVRGKNIKKATNEVLGTCVSLGVTCNGKSPREIIKEVNNGDHDSLLTG